MRRKIFPPHATCTSGADLENKCWKTELGWKEKRGLRRKIRTYKRFYTRNSINTLHVYFSRFILSDLLFFILKIQPGGPHYHHHVHTVLNGCRLVKQILPQRGRLGSGFVKIWMEHTCMFLCLWMNRTFSSIKHMFKKTSLTGADPENFSRGGGGPTLSKIDSVWRITVEVHKYEK